jgi:hypothetical protein
MIRSRIVEIDGAFDETQTEKSHIKIEIPLRIARDRSDMMKATNFNIHGVISLIVPTSIRVKFIFLINCVLCTIRFMPAFAELLASLLETTGDTKGTA